MKNVDDVYPLAPMQEMMLLHALHNPAADMLFEQFCLHLTGRLDVAALRDAWRQLIERHSVLRTAFLWQGLKQPLQVVRRQVELPFRYLDWRGRSPQEQDDALRTFRDQDRRRPFDPTKAPLLRVAVMRLADDDFRLLWSNHHLLLDRWCLPLVFADLSAHYEANCDGRSVALAKAPQYRDYIAWIQRQDRDRAWSFWGRELAGFDRSTPLTVAPDPARRGLSPRRAAASYRCAALHACAAGCGVTLSTLLQAAWALLLNAHSGRQDVVFGVTVSGRPPDLPGVDAVAGSFINNLPVRVRLPQEQTLSDWLKGIQAGQQRRNPYEYVSLSTIHELSGLAPTDRLFDSLLVWLAPAKVGTIGDLQVQGESGGLTTAYPLTLGVSEGDQDLSLQLVCVGELRGGVTPEQLLHQLVAVLDVVLAADPHTRLAQLRGFRTAFGEPLTVGAVPAPPAPSATALPAGREPPELAALQQLLQGEWRQVLGREKIGLDDNFFDLGGNSLLAARLHTQVEAAVRKQIPLLALFTSATVAAMARAILDEKWPLKSDVVMPIRARGDAPPLFCIASPEVNTIGYALLARHLDPGQPVYLLQAPPPFSDRDFTPAELLALTPQYLAALQGTQPGGPYRLLAMCRGSHLALEIAAQLEAAGERVAFLGVVNTWGFYTIARRYRLQRLLNIGAYYARRLKGLVGRGPGRRSAAPQAPADKPDAGGGAALPPVAAGLADPWIAQVGWASADPRRIKFSGEITVFRIRNQPWWRTRDAGLGWGRQARMVRVERLPGNDHDRLLLEPEVQALAASLQRRLDPSSAAAGAPGDARQTLNPVAAGVAINKG